MNLNLPRNKNEFIKHDIKNGNVNYIRRSNAIVQEQAIDSWFIRNWTWLKDMGFTVEWINHEEFFILRHDQVVYMFNSFDTSWQQARDKIGNGNV